MNKKKLYLISLISFTIIASAALFILAYAASARSLARPTLYNEINALEDNTAQTEARNKDIENRIEDIETELSTKDTVNGYYMEYKKIHDDLTIEVESLKRRSSELDSEIEKKQSIAGLAKNKKGRTYSLTSDKSYICPDTIPAGRYTAKGNGTFTITNPSGKTRVSQNLDVAYEHSYTFNLSEKESICVTGGVTLTELK